MHLKRLKLRNFKSFAGATEIPFQTGFTGVAGPNGMGKSNISDAVLFVLGPTSSKALRADRLTHLFFNGGATKKPASECEVSLVFDNRDRLLPVESEDVEITRFVKLAPSDPDGYYSYFYVNGHRSTQGEIDAILSHARLSGDGYNLVQQGDVNRIVGMGPVPRRGLLERLAGISQYDEELARGEAKRTELEANLNRIHTLLGEIRSHLQSLEGQRLQAIQYRELQEQKRQAESRLARAGLLLARQEVESCRVQLEKLRSDLAALRTETKRLEDERGSLSTSIDKVEHEIASRGGSEAVKFKQTLDERRMDFARLDEGVRNAEEEIRSLTERADQARGQLETEQAAASALEAGEKSLAATLSEVEGRAKRQADELQAATSETDPSQARLVGTRKEILKAEREAESRQKEWEASVARREAAKASLSTAERDLAQSEEDRRTREMELRDAELRSKESAVSSGSDARSSSDFQKELFQGKAKEQALEREKAHLDQEVFELNRRYMALDARLKVRAEKGGAGSALAAVDFLLSERNLGKIAGIRGTVHELAEFDPKYQAALTIAGGGRFQALVVETDQVAEECIRLLRAEKRGRATFLPLNKMLSGRPKGKSLLAARSPGALGFALDLLRFDEALRPAFWYVFGETVVMEDLARARDQMGGVRLVTLQGDLIEATGAISGGYVDLSKGTGADNASELRRLGAELREKTSEAAGTSAELAKLEERLRALSEELAKRSGQADAHLQTRTLLEKELKTARDRFGEARERVSALEAAQAQAEKELSDSETEAGALETALSALKETRERLQQEYLSHLPASLSKRIQLLHEANQKATEERLKASRELEGIRASLVAAAGNLKSRQAESEELDRTLKERTKQLAGTRKKREAAKGALEALRSVESQQSERVQGLSEEKRRLEERRLGAVETLARSQESLRSKLDLEHADEVRLATSQAKLSEVEELAKQFPESEGSEPTVPLDELRRAAQSVQVQIDAMGSVNLLALEEYDQEKSRLEGFEGEVQRLGEEKRDLLKLVGEIEKRKREKLGEVVVQVNAGYRTIYGELSGGGEGEISLENSADPLAGGLLIKARPVGKTVQRLEQLSGGEKSLASLAFIFALQRYDPSPLYVFDEIDMSLDGVNAENVGRMLRRNAERAQFIVISLRKVTLRYAQQLFGVTMRGDGISKVVSLKLDEIVDVDERDRPAEPSALPPIGAIAPGAV